MSDRLEIHFGLGERWPLWNANFLQEEEVKAPGLDFPCCETEGGISPCFSTQHSRGWGGGIWPFHWGVGGARSLIDHLQAIWETYYWQIVGECPGSPEASRAQHCLHGAIKGPPQLVSRSQGSETKGKFLPPCPCPPTSSWFVASSGTFVLGRNSFTNRNYERTHHGHNKNAGSKVTVWKSRNWKSQWNSWLHGAWLFLLAWLTTELESQLRSCVVLTGSLSLSSVRSFVFCFSPFNYSLTLLLWQWSVFTSLLSVVTPGYGLMCEDLEVGVFSVEEYVSKIQTQVITPFCGEILFFCC